MKISFQEIKNILAQHKTTVAPPEICPFCNHLLKFYTSSDKRYFGGSCPNQDFHSAFSLVKVDMERGYFQQNNTFFFIEKDFTYNKSFIAKIDNIYCFDDYRGQDLWSFWKIYQGRDLPKIVLNYILELPTNPFQAREKIKKIFILA